MHRKTILSLFIVVLAGILTGCAYFNTFYNAEQYFEIAEQARLEQTDENLPSNARDAYEKVIIKSQIVLEKYPDSKFADTARLLIGISQYHLKHYSIADQMFRHLIQNGNNSIQSETRYWLAMCKWKQGLPQPALDDLSDLTTEDISEELLTTTYLSISELFLERDDSKNALEMLDKAALIASSSSEKSQIYYRLSNLAEEKEDWDKAVYANEQVIKHSLAKNRIFDSHKKIIRINRITGNLDRAYSKAKKLQKDDDFADIHSDLHLEIGKLTVLLSDTDKALEIFKEISVEYPGTLASAEAKFILGEQALNENWNFKQAKELYENVVVENRQSPFSSLAQTQIKYIDKILTAEDMIRELAAILIDLSDSSAVDSSRIDSSDIADTFEEMAKHRYKIAEVKTFHFNKLEMALLDLDTLLSYPKTVSYYPKALFLKSNIYNKLSRIEESEQLDKDILEEWPDSEYAADINKSSNMDKVLTPAENSFILAEKLWSLDPDSSFIILKEIIKIDTLNTVSASALYFLAHNYDRTFYEKDSALKYYELLDKYHPDSEQAAASKHQLAALLSTFAELKTDTTALIVPDSLVQEQPSDSLSHEIKDNFISPVNTIPDSISQNPVENKPDKPEEKKVNP